MMVFHSFTAWQDYRKYNEELGVDGMSRFNSRAGSYAALTLDFRPLQHFRIYGLAAMNEYEIPVLERGPDTTVPDSLAFQLGAEAFIPVSRGHITFGLEGVYTSPYMYILRHRNWSFYRESTEMSNTDPPIREWTGTSFGPDAIAGTLWFGYNNLLSRWQAALSFLFLVQGENSTFDIFERDGGHDPQTPEEATALSPTGTPSYTYRINVGGAWRHSDFLNFSMQAGYIIVQNFNHISGNLEHGFELSFAARFIPQGLRAARPVAAATGF
jgi:hypothetical protein